MERSPFTDEQILAVLLEEAPAGLAEALRAAESADPPLRDRVAHLAGVVEALGRAGRMEQLFAVERERLDALAARTAPRPGMLDGLRASLRHVVATLVTDSGRERAALPGFRAAESGRRLVFEVDGIEVRVHITPVRPAIEGVSAGEVMVLGQVSGLPAPGVITLRGAEGREVSSPVGEDGFFEVGLAPGGYGIEIDAPGLSVSIPSADLTAIP